MRPSLAALAIAILAISFWQSSSFGSSDATAAPTIYDPNPTHLWNRLHSAIFVRPDIPRTTRVPDALDPPLWYHTSYLLTPPSHRQFLKILDEFLNTHGERLIQDPVKRALLERDLWSVFDWSVSGSPNSISQRMKEKSKSFSRGWRK